MKWTIFTFAAILFGLNANLYAQEDIEVLMILPNRLGLNYNFNHDDINEWGWHVTYTGMTEVTAPCPWSTGLGMMPVPVDTLLTDITDISNYDVLAIEPAYWRSGVAYGDLLGSPEALQLIRDARDSGVVIWATCAGVRVNEAILNAMADDLPQGNIVAEDLQITQTEITANGFSWEYCYGGTLADGGHSLIRTGDGGYAFTGYTYSGSSGKADILLVKTLSDGSLHWSKAYGGPGFDYGYSLCETATGELIITGFTTSTGNGLQDVILIKTHPDGKMIWNKTFGGENIDVARSVAVDTDGNYLICGYTQSFGNGFDDIYFLKTDTAGNAILDTTYGGYESEQGKVIRKAADGNWFILGSTGTYATTGNRDFYLMKVSGDGIVISDDHYHYSNYDDAYDILEDEEGNRYLLGHGDEHGEEVLDVLLIKTDAGGNVLWNKVFESDHAFYDYGKAMVWTTDGNIMICANSRQNTTMSEDLYLFMVDKDGIILWEHLYKQDQNQWITGIVNDEGNGFTLAGYNEDDGSGSKDAWMMNLANPLVSTGSLNDVPEMLFGPFIPNPFSTSIRFAVNIKDADHDILEIYSQEGIKINSFELKNKGWDTFIWDTSDSGLVPAGIYICRYFTEGRSYSRKIVKRD